MGSYLSIVNNTDNVWYCDLGPDMAALKIFGMIVTVIGTIAAGIATVGAVAPLATALAANGVVSVFGVSTASLVTVTTAAATAAGVATATAKVSDFGIKLAKGVAENLVSKGYQKISPGETHRWGKMTLSLWQQGTCTRTYIIDERTVRTETLYMRPIFSGPTAGSDNKHYIQTWVDKKGVETKEVVAETVTRLMAGDNASEVLHYHPKTDNVSDLEFNEGQVVYIYQD